MEARSSIAFIAGTLLVVMGLFAVMSTAPNTTTPASPTALSSATTEMLADSPNREGWQCNNVMDWNFFNAVVTENNLGGQGPNKSDKREIRYSSVYRGHDGDADLVVITENSDYRPNKAENNGLLGQFGQVNIMTNTEAKLKFQLVKAGTDTPIDVAKDETILFSVYDLDTGFDTINGKKVPNGNEYVKFTSGVASHSVTDNTTVAVSGNNEDGTLYAQNTRLGNAADNPTDPLQMTDLAEDSKISVSLVGTSTWEFTFGSKGVHRPSWMKPKNYRTTGRNILFAGRSEGDCACVGIADWTLHNNLKYNNLGGLGPVTSDPAELRYEKVFTTGYELQPVDLVIKVANGSQYIVANTALNGLWPINSNTTQMGQVNIKTGTQSTFDFMFVKTGTDELYELSNVMFSVYNLDQKAKGMGVNHEYVEFNTAVTNWTLTDPTLVNQSGSISGAEGLLKFTSTEAGYLSDNPTDPLKLTPMQMERSVTVWYQSKSKFQITLGHSAEISNPKAGGRNMLFAGPGIYCPK